MAVRHQGQLQRVRCGQPPLWLEEETSTVSLLRRDVVRHERAVKYVRHDGHDDGRQGWRRQGFWHPDCREALGREVVRELSIHPCIKVSAVGLISLLFMPDSSAAVGTLLFFGFAAGFVPMPTLPLAFRFGEHPSAKCCLHNALHITTLGAPGADRSPPQQPPFLSHSGGKRLSLSYPGSILHVSAPRWLDLQTRSRPKKIEEVAMQDEVVKVLKRSLEGHDVSILLQPELVVQCAVL
jgi:hypothetical protein